MLCKSQKKRKISESIVANNSTKRGKNFKGSASSTLQFLQRCVSVYETRYMPKQPFFLLDYRDCDTAVRDKKTTKDKLAQYRVRDKRKRSWH